MLNQPDIVLEHKHDRRKPSVASTQRLIHLMYNSSDLESPCFWHQSPNGIPIGAVHHTVDGNEVPISVLKANTLDPTLWAAAKKPPHYIGTWPPSSALDLLGTPSKEELCVVCEGKEICSCDYSRWVDEMHNFFVNEMRISAISGKGYGVFSRASIPGQKTLGEYTGELVPTDFHDKKTDEEAQYFSKIEIGKWKCVRGEMTTQVPKCSIDANLKGSVLRFMNHSCNANSELLVARVGMHTRVLIVDSLRPIAKGKEITIDYGPDYFRPGEVCMCGSKECRYITKKSTMT